MNKKRNQPGANVFGIFNMWTTWAIAVGALIAVLIVSLHISAPWLPLVTFGIEFLIFILIRRNRESRMPMCYLLPFLVTRILFWSGVIMVVINLMFELEIIFDYVAHENINSEIPFIALLIIAPVASIVAFWAYKRDSKLAFCEDCVIRHGTVAERGFLGNLFSQEARYQVKLLMNFSIALTVISWTYYFMIYINVNLNAVDKLVFFWLPVILFTITLISLGIRYFTLWMYYCQDLEGSVVRNGSFSKVRYMIFCGDKILLKKYNTLHDAPFVLENKYDTPSQLNIRYTDRVAKADSKIYFNALTGLEEYEIRLLYINTNFSDDCNIFHYACFIDDIESTTNSRLEGEWLTLPELNKLVESNDVSQMFKSEYDRIYTISMAWKSYDRKGRRLYNMRNYQPTFRLQDIRDWDVDYNDREWLFVSKNNQDRPYYKIKRFWRRIINGVAD